MEAKSRPLLVSRFSLWILRLFQENKLPFLASLLFGGLAYTFAFTNKLINHDEAGQLFAKGAATELGRWGLELTQYLFPNHSMPWIYGVISLVLMAIAICLILRIFHIRSKLLQVLLSGTIMVFPALIGLISYMFCSASYTFALLLGVFSVYCLRREKLCLLIPAFGCYVLSLGIYQAYISMTATLLVLSLIQDLLEGEEAFPVLKKGIFYLLFLLLGLGAYFAVQQAALWYKGVSYEAYAADAMTFSLSALPERIVTAYLTFIRYFTWRTRALIPTRLCKLAHLVLLLGGAMMFMLRLWKMEKKNIPNLGLLLLLTALLPLSINCLFLMTPEWSVHTLVLYSFACIYVFAAIVADPLMEVVFSKKLPELLRQAGLELTALSLVLILVCNTYSANAAYLQMHLRYENAYAFYTSLLTDIRNTPEFTQEDTPTLALVGNYQDPHFYNYHFGSLNELMGTGGFVPTSYTNGEFLQYYLGVNIPIASEEETARIMETQEYQDMACYPYYGSVKMIGDYLVVKLS